MGKMRWSDRKALSREKKVWRLRGRAEAQFDIGPLDEATVLAATLVDHTPPAHERRRLRLAMAAELLILRFEWAARNADDLRIACVLVDEIPAAPVGIPWALPYTVNVHAQARYAYGNIRGDTASLWEALRVLDAPQPPSGLEGTYRAVLECQAVALRGLTELALFQRTGQSALMEGAADHLRAAVDSFPGRSDFGFDLGPFTALLRVNLGLALRYRYHLTGAGSDLRDSYEALVRAHAELPDRHPMQSFLHTNLGGTLLAMYHAQGVQDHLDSAVDQFRKSLLATGGASATLPTRRSNLVLALLMSYEYTGAHAPLHEAVELARQAVVSADGPRGHLSAEAACFSASSLAAALVRRGELLHEERDFDEAVEVMRRAADGLPDGDPELPDLLKHLADAHVARYDAFGDPADLATATATARRMQTLPSVYTTDEEVHLSRLAALRTRAVDDDAGSADALRAELDEAVDLRRRLLALTDTRFDAVARGVNLAVALSRRHRLTGDPQDLTDALALTGAAALDDDAGEHDRLSAARLYAVLLLRKAGPRDDAPELRQAAAVWRATVASPLLTPEDRVHDARQLATVAARTGDWAGATDAYTQAIELLPQLAWHGIGWSSRENVLGRLAGLASDAAACAIAAGRPKQALTLLEQGRGVLWRQVLDFRADLTALRAEQPDLVRDLEETREAMLRAGADTLLPAPQPGDGPAVGLGGRELDRHMTLARRWDKLVARVRALPGQEHFLRVPPFEGVPQHAPDLAVLNVSGHGCHALLVQGGLVTALPLATTWDEVVERAGRFLDAHHDDGADGNLPADIAADCLAWLYETIAGPVLDALGVPDRAPRGGRSARRIMWSPTGPLTFLPLHAAGLHTTRLEPAPKTVLDRAVSSYTPSLRSLTDGAGGGDREDPGALPPVRARPPRRRRRRCPRPGRPAGCGGGGGGAGGSLPASPPSEGRGGRPEVRPGRPGHPRVGALRLPRRPGPGRPLGGRPGPARGGSHPGGPEPRPDGAGAPGVLIRLPHLPRGRAGRR